MAATVFIPDPHGSAGGGSAVRLDEPLDAEGNVVAIDGTTLPSWWIIPTGGNLSGGSATVFFS